MGLFSKKVQHIPIDDESVKRVGRALYKAHGSGEKARQVSMWLIDDPGDRELILAEVERLGKEDRAE